MNYRFAVLRSAKNDIADAIDYYNSERVGLGERFDGEVERMFKNIIDNPFMYPRYFNTRYRNALLDIFPYKIFYEVLTDEIVVAAVFNTNRNPDSWQNRGS